jgi:hypothetical protein
MPKSPRYPFSLSFTVVLSAINKASPILPPDGAKALPASVFLSSPSDTLRLNSAGSPGSDFLP